MEFGSKVRKLRVDTGLSAREVARKINISPLKLIDIEDGLKAVNEDFVNKLAIVFNLPDETRAELLDIVRKINYMSKTNIPPQKKLKAKQLYEKIMSEKTQTK